VTASAFESLAPLEPLMDKCVHCGFCLPTCPSYLLLGQEMDSPRGRIYLMRAGVDDRVAMSDTFAAHFDTCLGCMACETACPSGVRYAPLVEETRAAIEHHHSRSVFDRAFRFMLFQLLPYPTRLRLLALPLAFITALRQRSGALAWLPVRIRNLIELAPDQATDKTRAIPSYTPATGERRQRVGLVTGCVQRVFFGHVNEATVRVLAAEGCDVIAPENQGCCGALALHAGRDEEARDFARRLIAAFESTDAKEIVINAAGCGSSMKMYGELLKDDPVWAERARVFSEKVRDVTETLAGLLPARAPRRPITVKVAYHDACHLAHAQGIRREPRDLLESIPGITLVPLAENEICCGSAGIFNLVQPEMAATLGRRKASHIAASGADLVVTSNPGCILQIRAASRAAGQTQPVLHIIELIDRAQM
jgi:glycolate dehydrogenase iron-sulfur subunit